jgi:subtilisin family serine protease
MTQEEKYKIISDDYVDLILKYNGNPISLQQYNEYSVHIMNDTYAVIYLPRTLVTSRFVTQYNYSSIPHCYALTSGQSLEASGITKLTRSPNLNLRGEGVIVGIIDTGIDYTNPVFQHEDGTTKIISIWDQSIDSENQYPDVISPAFYGTEYTAEQINLALQSDNPLEIVPSMDVNGHGTKLAGIAAGSENQEFEFSGVVPDADIIVVKLKETKPFLRNFFSIPENVPAYQENDIIWGIQYLVDSARSLQRPIAICIALGTSMGAHDTNGALNTIVSIIGDFPGVAISISAGNEGNARRHFYSTFDPDGATITVELNVGENVEGFTMEFWGNIPSIYTVDILSPSGEYIPRILENLVKNQEVGFVFEQTVISIDFIMVETDTGKQVILFRFKNPSQGTWRFQVYGRGDLKGDFHIWLPPDDFISKDTYFLNSNPYTTVTSPGNSVVPITVTAYNSNLSTLYTEAGRGFSASNNISPDLAAPGVNIQCPDLNHGFATISGTGAAAAHTTGITAMVLEWSIVEGNFPRIDTVGIKKFLIRGARRSSNLVYPNRDWGYGIIDIYNSFSILRSDVLIK